MTKKSRVYRIIYFLLTFGWLALGFIYFRGDFLSDSTSVVLFSSLLMLAFTSCFLEHFFTRPTDVIASTLAILLLMTPLKSELVQYGDWYNYFLLYTSLLLVISLTATLLLDDTKPTTSMCNVISKWLKHIAVSFGKGKLLYGGLFILTMLFYRDSQTDEFLYLFFTAAFLLIVNPEAFIRNAPTTNSSDSLEIGRIFGVQSKNTFLVKRYNQKDTKIRRFDFVEFRYSMDESRTARKGLVIDNYFLNEEQWLKVLYSPDIETLLNLTTVREKFEDNTVYLISPEKIADNSFLERFVGVVIEGSNIEKLRFEYGFKAEVSEGDLLEVKALGKTILYQIIQGSTDIEMLESKNEAGLIVGEAVQLGEWNTEKQTFEKFGWVPEINAPVMLADNIAPITLAENEYQLGCIPNSNFPCIVNKEEAISHHLAVLGVTGSGKSVFSRELVRNVANDGWKIIAVDFTGEYKGRFSALNPIPIIKNGDTSKKIFLAAELMAQEIAKGYKGEASTITKQKNIMIKIFKESLKEFFESQDNQMAVFELPEVSNTDVTLEYTKWFFKTLFDIARKEKNYGKKVCVVLEEAHTVIPEYGFSGMADKTSQALVNSVAQIALQGRKYDIGFIVIAQRTANVSKTVLTQCNSFIAFQQFDKTSGDFFSNILGKDMVAALPRLKKRQAIAVGKAFKANMPMIFEVNNITEEDYAIPASFQEVTEDGATEETAETGEGD